MRRGEIWWADFGEPIGSAPGYKRPVVVLQIDAFNRSRIRTVTVVPISSTRRLAQSPGNILLSTRKSGLEKVSVVNVSQVSTIDREAMISPVKLLEAETVKEVEAGVRLVLGL